MRKSLDKFLLFINLGLLLFTVLTYLAKYVSPNVFWPISITGLFLPWVFFANIIFCLYWLLRKSKYIIFPLSAVILGIGSIGTFINFNTQKPKNDASITLASYNIAGVRSYSQLSSETEKKLWKKEFQSYFTQRGIPEIVALQETGQFGINYLKQTFDLNDTYKHYGTAILSTFPILKKGALNLGKTRNSAVWADIKTNKGLIRVYNIHLQSNKISNTTEDLAKKANLEDKETFKKVYNVFARYKRASQLREKQGKIILKHIDQSPYPVILLGDFNDTPQSTLYQSFAEKLKDGFVEAGRGLGTTYAGSIPFLRIDYIMADTDFKFLNYATLKGNYSDHFPVILEIELD